MTDEQITVTIISKEDLGSLDCVLTTQSRMEILDRIPSATKAELSNLGSQYRNQGSDKLVYDSLYTRLESFLPPIQTTDDPKVVVNKLIFLKILALDFIYPPDRNNYNYEFFAKDTIPSIMDKIMETSSLEDENLAEKLAYASILGIVALDMQKAPPPPSFDDYVKVCDAAYEAWEKEGSIESSNIDRFFDLYSESGRTFLSVKLPGFNGKVFSRAELKVLLLQNIYSRDTSFDAQKIKNYLDKYSECFEKGREVMFDFWESLLFFTTNSLARIFYYNNHIGFVKDGVHIPVSLIIGPKQYMALNSRAYNPPQLYKLSKILSGFKIAYKKDEGCFVLKPITVDSQELEPFSAPSI